MKTDNYKQYLIGTVRLYNNKQKNYVRKMLVEKQIATDGLAQIDVFGNYPTVDVSDLELEEQVVRCLNESSEAVRLFETWEYEKDYRYSAVFTTSDYQMLLQKLDQVRELPENQDESLITVLYDDKAMMPSRRNIDGQTIIKFSFAFSAVHPQTQNELLCKYPVLVVLHEQYELIEIRFDTLKQFFEPNRDFYLSLIRSVVGYFKTSLGVTLDPLDMSFMKDAINDEVMLVAEHMNLVSGGKAVLEVGDNEDCVLPFIGELRSLIQDHRTELESVPSLRDALEQFIYEKSEMSEYPWIELKWNDEIKTRSMRVKFTFNYANSGFGMIQHYQNPVLVGKGRMDRVVKHIGENRSRDRE